MNIKCLVDEKHPEVMEDGCFDLMEEDIAFNAQMAGFVCIVLTQKSQ